MVMKMLAMECTWLQYPEMGEKPRQMFVTRSPHLATKVGETFFKMLEAHIPGVKLTQKVVTGRRPLIGRDEEEKRRHIRLGDLNDEDFPQFLSYDCVSESPGHLTVTYNYIKLCSMIEAELGIRCQSQERLISYEVFLERYYPRFHPSLRLALGKINRPLNEHR